MERGKEVAVKARKDAVKAWVRAMAKPLVMCAVMVACWAMSAHAGAGGTEFNDIYTTLSGWTSGGLGKTIAGGAFLVGIAMGVVKQSIIAVVSGLGTALAVANFNTIQDAIITALI